MLALNTFLARVSFVLSSALICGLPAEAAPPGAATSDTTPYTASITDMRDHRYCEVLYGIRSFLTIAIKVFSTEGLNDCPEDAWKSITKKPIADLHNASFVLLNGPRYWTVDGLQAGGNTVTHTRERFNGLEMNLRATIDIGVFKQFQQLIGDTYYQVTPVDRHTKWIFKAGSPVFELVSSSGEVYVMQSYAQIVNPELSIADLPMLSQQLDLPKGWTYRTRLLTEDLFLVANGTAYVIQDNLMNSYQRQ